jgi:uncharacterized membrane protein
MSQQHQDHQSSFQLERIALFSDAVFAIAITLLIIEIKVPNLPFDKNAFNEEFGHSMQEMIPEFIGFLISFMVIGSFWKAHHTLFGFVKDYDRKLLSLNNWFLLSIVAMPFTTAFMSRYLFIQPFFIYSCNVIISGLFQVRLWRYIVNTKHNLHTTLPKGMAQYKTATPLVVVSCFVMALLIHVIIDGIVARVFLSLLFIINIFVERYFKKKYQLSKRY